jgi:hypothetical protein
MRNIFKLNFLLLSRILIYHPESKAHKLTFKLALLSMAKLNSLNLSWKSISRPHNTTNTHLLCLSWSFAIPQHCIRYTTFLDSIYCKILQVHNTTCIFSLSFIPNLYGKEISKEKKTHNNLINNQHLGICQKYFDIWSQ